MFHASNLHETMEKPHGMEQVKIPRTGKGSSDIIIIIILFLLLTNLYIAPLQDDLPRSTLGTTTAKVKQSLS